MTLKLIGRLLVLSSIFLISCQSQESYTYEEIRPEIEQYLRPLPHNNFADADTLTIYDSNYFEKMRAALSKYEGKLIVEDSVQQQLIVQRLIDIQKEKIQTRQPQIYLPFQVIKEQLQPQYASKIATYLTALPQQFEAAKAQLEKPDLSHTQQTIEELKAGFSFVSNDVAVLLQQSNAVNNYEEIIENARLTIKDYIAFLNSKILNQEVNQEE